MLPTYCHTISNCLLLTSMSPKYSLHDVQPHLHHFRNLQTLLIGTYLTPSISVQDQTGFFGYGYSCNYQKYVYSLLYIYIK